MMINNYLNSKNRTKDAAFSQFLLGRFPKKQISVDENLAFSIKKFSHSDFISIWKRESDWKMINIDLSNNDELNETELKLKGKFATWEIFGAKPLSCKKGTC